MKGHRARLKVGRRALLVLSVASVAACLIIHVRRTAAGGGANARTGDEVERLIDSALYARAEFFGAQARVPYPTNEARNRLAALRARLPKEPRASLALARLDESLGRYESAEQEMGDYVAEAGDGQGALEELAAFQHRRAFFAKEAATLERMLRDAPDTERGRVLDRLVRLAGAQKLEGYLSPEFFERVIAEHPSDFRVVADYVDKLTGEKGASAALDAVRRYRGRFPSRRRYFVEKEVSLLDAAGRAREAEAVYVNAFDPFWPDDLSERFYDFLREHDRFRAYGGELREAFRRDPSDFRVAVGLFHFRKHAYDEETVGIFAKLEEARAARRVSWEPEELATAARLLIKEGDGDTASRLLYTLVARGRFAQGSPARAQVLYQLFELLTDAGDERLALTRGDLRFYRDVAASDPHPGMLGGVLSLIFSGESPAREMDREDEAAVKLFNRAAAYRIFNAYKEENPTSPELAQMYLDVVRLYAAAKEPHVAETTLAEFEQRYGDAPQYAEVALKLADCYLLLGRHEEERAVYRRVLDYLGKRRDENGPLVPATRQATGAGSYTGASASLSEPTEILPSIVEYPPKSNPGVKVDEGTKTDPYDYGGPSYRDFLAPRGEGGADAGGGTETTGEAARAMEGERDGEPLTDAEVTYADVRARAVASLAKENRTDDVLALYAGEIKKYPNEQGLYEQMLQWLGQTNLFEEQSRVYKEALERFPTEAWRDRLARWLLRRERGKEFDEFSRELIGKLDDREAERYLEKFAGASSGTGGAGLKSNLYVGLYSLAHERFPGNLSLVRGLLKFYAEHDRWDEYRRLLAEYYFVSPEIREQFLAHLAERGELRARLSATRDLLKTRDATKASDGSEPAVASLPYKLFRADAAARLSNYEEAVDAYRELNRLYPATPEFAGRLIAFTRSLGQHNRTLLQEAAAAARDLADAQPSEPGHRTRAGEVFAELGDYDRARAEWAQLVSLAPGDNEAYLDAATVFWDYFQYGDALETINRLRRETGDRSTYAFEAGAILEAQHRPKEAVAEYVKALDEDSPAYGRARKRLVALSRRAGVAEQIGHAYSVERARGSIGLALGYAALLKEVGRRGDAARLLAGEVARSADADFIERERAEFADAEDAVGERACLSRLIQVSTGPRQVISDNLRLAENYGRHGERNGAASILRGIVRKFPVNYGVLQEASSFFRRLGLDEESLQVLRDGAARGRGRYRREFARKLAARLLELNRVAETTRVLEPLHAEDPLDLGVFRELARLYARAGEGAELKAAFNRTLEAVRATDADPKEVRGQVAELRRAMIGVFTGLRDYRAAMEQHVEIVDRDPDDEDAVEAAIAYAKRYGGADELLAYYRKTASLAYKNYRWDVVLARVYEAKNDPASAARSYKEAIADQPEMAELHAALAEVCVKAGGYDEALAALDRAAELSNDDPQYVRRTAEVLELAGRKQEAEAVRGKLAPAEAPKVERAEELFADAERALASDRAKAVEQYRGAFASMSADPYRHELRASEITGYVRAVRDAEGLDIIFERLWGFREKLIADADRKDGKDAGRARILLGVLDGALPDAVGPTAAEVATGDELAPLFRSLREKIDGSLRSPDAHGTLSLLQNLSHLAGFVVLEEHVLVAQKDAARASGDAGVFHERLRSLVSFYAAGGEYARAVELLEAESSADPARDHFEYASLLAEHARLSGDGGRELSALRSYYEGSMAGSADGADPLVARYFDLLYESDREGREELRRRAQEPSGHSVQLINFLITKGERELAHAAIHGAGLPAPWKLARDAQVSLALGEFDSRGEAYFAAALTPASIGQLLGDRAAADDRLTGDGWSRLEADYGRWLYLSGGEENRGRAAAALPAVIESRPRDAGAQAQLARWYLSQGDARAALEHLIMADEETPGDPRTLADLGSAQFLLGERDRAEAAWAKLIGGEAPSPGACLIYLKTLAAHGLAARARDRLLPLVVKRLKGVGVGYNAVKKFEELKPLLAALSASFAGALTENFESAAADGTARQPLPGPVEDERATFFRKLCEAAQDDTDLPRFIVEGGLVGRARLDVFYRLLIARSAGPQSYEYDYEFTAFVRNAFGVPDTEEAFDHANSFRAEEPRGERVGWQKQYLQYLIEEGRNAEAGMVASSVEGELSRRFARPGWLRLAKARLELRGGQSEKAIADLQVYVGADAAPGLPKISAPSAERLSDALALLRGEHCESATPRLIEATYTQLLALNQYQTSYFVALAGAAFGRGDGARGDKLLRLMINLSADETRDDAAAEVAALSGVGARLATLERAELPEAANGIERAEALELAAVAAGSFGRYEEALGFRASLTGVKPDDYANRIELARLLAAVGRREEAAAQLSDVISDRRAPRAARWRAVWIAPEVAGGRGDLWDSLVGGAATVGGRGDGEMAAALKARELWAEGRIDDAADLLERATADDPNPLLDFFRGLLDLEGRRGKRAAGAFASAFRSPSGAGISTAFGADEDDALSELIRLHLSSGRPFAALKLASLDQELVKKPSEKGGGSGEGGEGAGAFTRRAQTISSYLTLNERAAARRSASKAELLGLLSVAAEQVKDFDKSVEFERARMSLLWGDGERAASGERVGRLVSLQKGLASASVPPLIVDRTMAAQR
jgi:tetratricopeptide (TPR) repeat protein